MRPFRSQLKLIVVVCSCLALIALGGCGEPATSTGGSNTTASNNPGRPTPPAPPRPGASDGEGTRPNDPYANRDGADTNDTNDPYANRDGADDTGTTDGESPDTGGTSDSDGGDGQNAGAADSSPPPVQYDATGRPIRGDRAARDDGADSAGGANTDSAAPGVFQPDEPPPQTAEEAVVAIQAIGGRIKTEGSGQIHVFLNRTDATDWHMQAVALLAEVTVLNISHTQVTDGGLEPLGRLTKLERLYPHGTAVTDSGLESLGKALPKLRVLK